MTDNLLLDGHKVIYELMSSLTMLHFDGSRVVASCWRWSRYDEMKRELHEGASSLEVEECSCGGWGGLCLTAIGPEFEVEICMCDMHTHFLRTFYVMNNLMKF